LTSFKKFVFSSNQVEYEIDSGSDEENEKARKDRDGSSAEDSDIEVTFFQNSMLKLAHTLVRWDLVFMIIASLVCFVHLPQI
jgi:hypothetical protein